MTTEPTLQTVPEEQQALRTIAATTRMALQLECYDPGSLYRNRCEAWSETTARLHLTNVCIQMLTYASGLLQAMLNHDIQHQLPPEEP